MGKGEKSDLEKKLISQAEIEIARLKKENEDLTKIIESAKSDVWKNLIAHLRGPQGRISLELQKQNREGREKLSVATQALQYIAEEYDSAHGRSVAFKALEKIRGEK